MQRAGLTIGALSVAGTALLLCAPVGRAEEKQTEAEEIESILQQFSADQWESRAKAFYRFVALGRGDGSDIASPVKRVLEEHPEQAEQIKVALIRLLERENARMEELNLRYQKTGQKIGRDYDTDYYANVIAAVVTLKDIRSMNALLGAITTGGMAMGTLAEFAPLSLDPVLAKGGDPDPLVRMSALNVLERMLEPTNYDKVKDAVYRSRIKEAFIRATRDENAVVRKVGTRGLGALGDPDVIPLLRRLAEHDPAFLPRQADGGKDLYIVRKAAKEALVELRRKTRKPD